ncbi:MAG: carboxymuconolactone decarboxylase family protein [Proteobacteria bacterium]|nr:carboxymuconolactone decarboxylase family protein [Pseudomonadota bacterium]
MADDVKEFYKEFPRLVQKMAQDIPDMVKGFQGLVGKSLEPGALDTKQKEFIALGIAVAQHCAPCIYLHTQKAVQAGATRKEILEAAGVAIFMGGGPAFTHVAEVVKALDALGVA